MRMQCRLPSPGGHLAQSLARHGHPVADAAAKHDHMICAADRHLTPHERNHAGVPALRSALVTASASGVPLTWQTATASASEAWSLTGIRGSPSNVCTMRATWSFAARPCPHTADLTCWGV